MFDDYAESASSIPLQKDYEILKEYIIGMIEIKNKKQADKFRTELAITRQRILMN